MTDCCLTVDYANHLDCYLGMIFDSCLMKNIDCCLGCFGLEYRTIGTPFGLMVRQISNFVELLMNSPVAVEI